MAGMRLIGRSKRALIGLGLGLVIALAGVIAPTEASASANGCTFVSGGIGANQCLFIQGGGTHIDWVQETYTVYNANACRYQGQWEGNAQGKGWYYYWSAYTAGCSFLGATTGHYTVGNGYFVNGSSFYGWWRSDNTGDSWTSPDKLTIHS